jgi:hypothetical protein
MLRCYSEVVVGSPLKIEEQLYLSELKGGSEAATIIAVSYTTPGRFSFLADDVIRVSSLKPQNF